MFANQQHSTGELLQTLLQTFIVFFLICFWVSLPHYLFRQYRHTQNKTGGKIIESRGGKFCPNPAVSLSPTVTLFTNCLIFKLHTQRLVLSSFAANTLREDAHMQLVHARKMRNGKMCTNLEISECLFFFFPRAKFTRISTCQVAELLNKLARGTLEMKSKFYPLFMPHSWERVSISEIFA